MEKIKILDYQDLDREIDKLESDFQKTADFKQFQDLGKRVNEYNTKIAGAYAYMMKNVDSANAFESSMNQLKEKMDALEKKLDECDSLADFDAVNKAIAELDAEINKKNVERMQLNNMLKTLLPFGNEKLYDDYVNLAKNFLICKKKCSEKLAEVKKNQEPLIKRKEELKTVIPEKTIKEYETIKAQLLAKNNAKPVMVYIPTYSKPKCPICEAELSGLNEEYSTAVCHTCNKIVYVPGKE